MAPMHFQHDQGRGPWIPLHVVSGPWTFFVAVHDKGQMKHSRMQATQKGFCIVMCIFLTMITIVLLAIDSVKDKVREFFPTKMD